MNNKTDKNLDLQAERDLGALEGFLHILAEQVLVLHDNVPDMETVDSEKLEEVQRELVAIARGVRMASTMADTAHDDYKTLLEKAYAPVRPLTLTEEHKDQIREVVGKHWSG